MILQDSVTSILFEEFPADVRAILGVMPDTWMLMAFRTDTRNSDIPYIGYIDVYDTSSRTYLKVMNPVAWDGALENFCTWVRSGCIPEEGYEKTT